MAEQKEYVRFSVAQRFEHWVLVLSFTLLALTGLPQKFAGDGWAESLIGLLGGIETVRIIHHTAAAVLSLAVIYHIIAVAYKVFVLRVRWTMFPRLDDVFDALDTVRYNLGLTKETSKLNRYGFAEKAEYWALVWGTVIMAITGFIMWNPINAAHFLSGDMIPTAKAAHGAEAILAVLAIIIWHFYGVHIKNFNKSMFTGKISEHQMQDEHALELEQINQAKADVRPAPDVIKKRERIFIPVATVLSVVMLVMLYLFISYEGTALTTLPRRVSTVQIFAPITPTPAGAAPGTASSAVPLPADHAGRTTCVACHANGVGPALPADHAGRTDATCGACHKVGGAPATAGTAAPTTGAGAAPTTGAGAGPKPLPADHAGRTTCNACHANGVGPAEPADHAGRTDATCTACHTSSSAPATVAPTSASAAQPTSAPTSASATITATKAAATAAPTTAATSTPAASTGPKPQPADHTGRTTCIACHANGTGPAEPADHAGRTDATCAACHTPSSAQATVAPTSASAAQPTAAATAATSATTQPSASAAGSTKEACLACHGPFDKLITSSANFVAPSGEKTSPHRFVPHTSTAASAVPECTNCHTAHPVPPTAKIDLSKVSVDWCYTTCHHQNDFTPCDKCHKDQ